MVLLILYLCLAIFVSFLCSILEAVLLSITPGHIEALEQKGSSVGAELKHLKKNIDRPLAAILSLNTIAHTVGAAGVGAQATIVFKDLSMGIISGGLTLIILVFSEIIPKTMGATYWRKLSGLTAYILKILIFILYPFVLLSRGITYLIKGKNKKSSVSREEVSAMADIGEREGVFEKSESRILKNLVALRSIRITHIMTPRTVMVAAPQTMTLQKMYKDKSYLRFSRIPIYDKSIDDVTGYIHKHDLLDKLAKDEHTIQLKDIKREIFMISDKAKIPDLYLQFIEKREQIALVVGDYGSVQGIVSMEDLLETLLGMEIVDEFDSTEDMQQYAREKWQQRAKKLGLISEEKQKEKESIAERGITGGKVPKI